MCEKAEVEVHVEGQSSQKRCSLPGPLNLYAGHQQRRLSDRGMGIYRPCKPDIDLIRDFTGTRKNSVGPVPVTLQQETTNKDGKMRKVTLRISQKTPGNKEKVFELQTMKDGSESSFLSASSKLETRRFSDSVAYRLPRLNVLGADESAGIVCSTGDLLTLKCLTSSAQEISFYNSPYEQVAETPNPPATSPLLEGREGSNRSKSFDATYMMNLEKGRGSGFGSSWFSRRHTPMAEKLPLPPGSPTLVSPKLKQTQLPIFTLTNENESQSEIIEIPSPPAGSPSSSPEEKSRVSWGKNGFVLDANVLGFAIESHLRSVEKGRRATITALYEPPSSALSVAISRGRSASACGLGINTNNPTFRMETVVSHCETRTGGSSGKRKASLQTTSIYSTDSKFWAKEGFPLSVPQQEMKRRASCIETLSHNEPSVQEEEEIEEAPIQPKISQQRQQSKRTPQRQPEEPQRGVSICSAIRNFLLHNLRS